MLNFFKLNVIVIRVMLFTWSRFQTYSMLYDLNIAMTSNIVVTLVAEIFRFETQLSIQSGNHTKHSMGTVRLTIHLHFIIFSLLHTHIYIVLRKVSDFLRFPPPMKHHHELK